MRTFYHIELAAAREALLGVYARVSDPNVPPSDGGWTARQIMHHLYLSENGIARVYRAVERVATPCELFNDEKLLAERDVLSAWVSNRDIKVEAPDRIQPLELGYDVDVLAQLAVSRDLLIDFSNSLSDEHLRSYTFLHPIRGALSLYGWLWFVAAHERRHTEQLRRQLGN